VAEPWVRVIADDLTGACDVGAALLFWPGRIVVRSLDAPASPDDADALVVVNTQSRTCAPEVAAARVSAALDDVPRSRHGTLLKKIDTALRGPLGAEIDAAMDAVGAEMALVVAAIPEAGRTTVDGIQLVDGIPVDETAFARDPQNPVRDARVASVIEATSRRRARSVALGNDAGAAIANARAEGTSIVVGDATTDLDIHRWASAARKADVRVLVGSTGLAHAWLYGHAAWRSIPRERMPSRRSDGGVLVVSGSAHPVTATQVSHLAGARGAAVMPVDVLDVAAAIARLADGETVCVTAPGGASDSSAVLEKLSAGALAVLERAAPRAIVLIGGETAHHLLARLGHPRLVIESAPATLVVRTTIAEGALAGMTLVTKGGSSGPPERLAELLDEVGR
jgi:D-threonate/D-erythronate kinase